jgi:hypothetical protein
MKFDTLCQRGETLVRPEDRLLASWRLIAMSRQQVKSSQKLVKYICAGVDVFQENLEHSLDNISRSTDILFEPWWTLPPGEVGQERS